MIHSQQGPKLHFLVYNPSRELCRVEMPVAAVDNLEHLFPAEDLQIVRAAGVDIPQIVQRAKQSGYAAQTLIDTHTSQRSYKIWIG